MKRNGGYVRVYSEWDIGHEGLFFPDEETARKWVVSVAKDCGLHDCADMGASADPAKVVAALEGESLISYGEAILVTDG